jgi:hypothetical protein
MSDDKKRSVKDLIEYFGQFNRLRLIVESSHPEVVGWLGEVAAVLKTLDEGDYQEFMRLRKSIYPGVRARTRKSAVHELYGFLSQKVAEYRRYDFIASVDVSPTSYVNQEIIEGFIKKRDGFNYKKLIKMLNEINSNHVAGHVYATSMLIRAVLDHIPPLFGCGSFDAVVSNYGWGKTDRDYMKSLLDFKSEGDDALHRQISGHDDLLDTTSLPVAHRFNRLLQECLTIEGNPVTTLSTGVQPDSELSFGQKLKVVMQPSTRITWANYSVSIGVWSCFRVMVEIDNYRSKRPDYLSFSLLGKTQAGDEWRGEHFMVQGIDKPDLPLRIEPEQIESKSVFISENPYGGDARLVMPDLDTGGLQLVIKARSGSIIKLPITSDLIGKG